MIVKNEAAVLADCLDSIRDIADQIVVVDTGSTDATLEIARDYGADIHHFKWQDHFAKARNESIKYARKEWILWIDADERLLKDSQPKLVKLLQPEQTPIVYKIQIQNLLNDEGTVSLSDAHRLFTNHKGICFSGRIHEQVFPSLDRLGGEERDSEVCLLHMGYSYTGAKDQAKRKRNKRLLQQMVREDPRNAYAHYTLGQYYGINKQHTKAIQHYKLAYQLKQLPAHMTASLLNVLAQELLKIELIAESKQYVQQSVKMITIQAGGYYLLHKLALAEDKPLEAIHWLKELLIKTRMIRASRKYISTDVLIDDDRILYTIGSLFHKNHQFDQAYNYYWQAYQLNSGNKELLKRLLEVSIILPREMDILQYVSRLEVFDQGDLEYLHKIALLMVKNSFYQHAINVYKRIRCFNPEDNNALKRLVGLYAKIGEMSKAEELAYTLNQKK